MINKLTSIFGQMDDPRRNVTRLYKLNDIFLMGIIAVTCGVETWNNIEEYACAKEDIAAKIISRKADYILAVKQNQKQLYENVEDEFRFSKAIRPMFSVDLDHGRIETRTCSIINEFHRLFALIGL